MTDYQDVIAGFVDNEAIEAEALGSALARPEGREYLLDLLVLRGLVGGAQFAGARAATASTTLQAATTPRPRGFWLALAAFLAAGVAAGFLAGRLGFMRAPVNDGGAIDDKVSSEISAPAPTHVIRMEKGVDWNEKSGGN